MRIARFLKSNPSQIVKVSAQLLDISKKTNATWRSTRWRDQRLHRSQDGFNVRVMLSHSLLQCQQLPEKLLVCHRSELRLAERLKAFLEDNSMAQPACGPARPVRLGDVH